MTDPAYLEHLKKLALQGGAQGEAAQTELRKHDEEVIHKSGDAAPLISWYNDGADGQIDWGSPGDFDACVAVAGKYIDDPEGFCNLRHQDATGAPPGKASSEQD